MIVVLVQYLKQKIKIKNFTQLTISLHTVSGCQQLFCLYGE